MSLEPMRNAAQSLERSAGQREKKKNDALDTTRLILQMVETSFGVASLFMG